jgi:hypothetical protein
MTVYVIQDPLMRDRDTGRLVRKMDFAPAEMFGRVEFLLADQAKPWDPDVVCELQDKLQDFRKGDWLLVGVGDPCLMAAASAIVADVTDGHLPLLKWSGKENAYKPVVIQAYDLAEMAGGE